MTKDTHTFPVRVYYEDTDAAGIVYYANYLKFAERARTEALRLAGFNQSELMRAHSIGFVVRKCVCEFFKPAMLDDLLTIETRLNDISRVSMAMRQTIRRGGETIVTLDVKLAVIGAKMKPVRLPEAVSKAMLSIL
ncbi:MAG: tol-pal system-associated acyl-CoA thioesterase [Pseudomonadota bacterium]|nr:tol-pal system-associated acyl-CoA thioesterase [Pseudomonadota bacterium]MDE3037965.1 tol-pal system-associated acyl-CoA thioesterase [Pseudomonadota bacterium]